MINLNLTIRDALKEFGGGKDYNLNQFDTYLHQLFYLGQEPKGIN